MPCGLTSGADYPDYLKGILKEIAVGNDGDLKACACSLRSPVNNEGCPILDEDGKVGAFPFCVSEWPEYGTSPLSLKTIMIAFWRVKTWRFTINARLKMILGNGNIIPGNYSGSITSQFNKGFSINQQAKTIKKQTDLVCMANLYSDDYGFISGPNVDDPIPAGLGGINIYNYITRDAWNNFHGLPLPSMASNFDGGDAFWYGNRFENETQIGTLYYIIDGKTVGSAPINRGDNPNIFFWPNGGGYIESSLEAIEYWH
jgi:hypothetical protein